VNVVHPWHEDFHRPMQIAKQRSNPVTT